MISRLQDTIFILLLWPFFGMIPYLMITSHRGPDAAKQTFFLQPFNCLEVIRSSFMASQTITRIILIVIFVVSTLGRVAIVLYLLD